MSKFAGIIIKALLALGLMVFGFITLAVVSVVIYRGDIDTYLGNKKKDLFSETLPDNNLIKYDYDCEVMDPIKVKFGDVFFTYSPSLNFRLETVHPSPLIWKKYRGAIPSQDWSEGELCETEQGFIEGPYGVTIPAGGASYRRALEALDLSLSESVKSIVVGPYLGIGSDDDPANNPALNRVKVSGTTIDAAQCTPVGERSRRLPRCRLWKEIDDTGIYITVTIQPARPTGGFINGVKVHGTEDWPAIITLIELSLSRYISVQ